MILRKRVFITRDLDRSNPFFQGLTKRGFSVEGCSLIRFAPIPFELPEEPCDWIFFYSKKAAHFFFDGLPEGQVAGSPLLAAIGEGTARVLYELGREVQFRGNGHPGETAKKFARVAGGQTVLFPRAKNSRRSIQRQLAGGICSIDLVVYDNEPEPRAFDVTFQYLVFTSPLNVTAYLQENVLFPDQVVIAIGVSTAESLLANGVKRVHIAPEPSENGLLQAILERENDLYGL